MRIEVVTTKKTRDWDLFPSEDKLQFLNDNMQYYDTYKVIATREEALKALKSLKRLRSRVSTWSNDWDSATGYDFKYDGETNTVRVYDWYQDGSEYGYKLIEKLPLEKFKEKYSEYYGEFLKDGFRKALAIMIFKLKHKALRKIDFMNIDIDIPEEEKIRMKNKWKKEIEDKFNDLWFKGEIDGEVYNMWEYLSTMETDFKYNLI